MSDLKEAGNLLRRAEMDLKAVQGMGDSAVFTDEVFGGRVQETAEKLLKSWLAMHGVKYPRTHDLALLLRLLGEHREPAAKFEELVEYTAYITKFRYGVLPEPVAPLERDSSWGDSSGLAGCGTAWAGEGGERIAVQASKLTAEPGGACGQASHILLKAR